MKDTVQIETFSTAAARLKAMQIVGVRWYRHAGQTPIELVGSVQRIEETDHDVTFTIIHGSDYEAYYGLRLSQCEIAPLIDGRFDWDYAFTVASLQNTKAPADMDSALSDLLDQG